MNARTDEALIEKLKSLPPQQRAEVEDFVDFLKTRQERARDEAALVPEHLNTFGDHTPKELWDEYRALVSRLG